MTVYFGEGRRSMMEARNASNSVRYGRGRENLGGLRYRVPRA